MTPTKKIVVAIVIVAVLAVIIYMAVASYGHTKPFVPGNKFTHMVPYTLREKKDVQLVMPPAGSGKSPVPTVYTSTATVADCIKAAKDDMIEVAVLNSTNSTCTGYKDSRGFTLQKGALPGMSVIARRGFTPRTAKA